MRLTDLLKALPKWRVIGNPDVDVTGLAFDSRQVRPGTLFVAYRGVNVDGHGFVGTALKNGAVAVVGERDVSEVRDLLLPTELTVPYVTVPDGRESLAWLSAAWHGFPARQLTLIGVTGTDGKTTTVNLIYRILQAAGRQAGMVSTVNAVIGKDTLDTGLHTTTPDAPDVQQMLAKMVAAGTDVLCAGGYLTRARSASRSRLRFRRGCRHQRHPRAPRYPQHSRSLPSSQGQPVPRG